MRRCLLAVLLIACSEDPEPLPTLTPEPSTQEADTDEASEPAETDEAEPSEDEGAPTARANDGEPSYYLDSELGDSPIVHPDARVQGVLRGLLLHLSRREAGEGQRRAPAYTEEETLELDAGADGMCRVHLMHESLFTIECRNSNYARMDISTRHSAHHFVIAGSDVRPFDPYDAFESREALDARLAAACQTELEEEDYGGAENDVSCTDLDPRLGFDGVTGVMRTLESVSENVPTEYVVAYEDLAEIIREDGLLMRLFTGGAPPDAPAVSAEDADGTAVSHHDLSHRLLARWQTLEPAAAARVGMARGEHGLAQLVYLGNDDAQAAAIATRLGASPTPVELEGSLRPLSPAWMKNRSELNLRAYAEGPVVAILPPGALVAPVDPSDRARYIEVETPVGSGFVGRNLLRAHSGCVPRAPAGFDASAQPLTAIVRMRRSGSSRDAALFAQGAGGHARVALHDVDVASCELGAERVRVEVDGELRDVRLTTTTANGGDTIVVVGAENADEQVSYAAAVVGGSAPVWAGTVSIGEDGRSGVRLGETADGSYFPVSFVSRRVVTRLGWTGSTLEVREPD